MPRVAPVFLKTVLGSSHPIWGCCASGHVFAKAGAAGDGKLLSPGKEGLESSWQGLSRRRAGLLPGKDWKCDKGHWVVVSGMSRKKKKKSRNLKIISLILTEANPQDMSFGNVGYGSKETCYSQGIPSTAAAVSTRLQILADCGHWQCFQDPT